MRSDRGVLILHGWQNRRPPDHWQFWLAERLRRRGERVLYPQLPSPDEPVLQEWLALLRAELAMLGDGERVVVCHSLARRWPGPSGGGPSSSARTPTRGARRVR